EAKMPVLRDMRHVAKKFAQREKRLVREQEQYQVADQNQRTAQMLTSSGMNMDQHYESVKVRDYFGDAPRDIEVQLDSTLSLRENIDKMFKQYQKAERGKSIVARQLQDLRGRRAALVEQTKRLQGIKDWDTWLAIASKIPRKNEPASASTAAPA